MWDNGGEKDFHSAVKGALSFEQLTDLVYDRMVEAEKEIVRAMATTSAISSPLTAVVVHSSPAPPQHPSASLSIITPTHICL
jgi:hypothetical protein